MNVLLALLAIAAVTGVTLLAAGGIGCAIGHLILRLTNREHDRGDY